MPHSQRLQEALIYAAEIHKGQDRDGEVPLPYISHPIEVLINLRYVGGCTDEDMLCAAALHDVIEESNIDLADIQAKFGSRVASLVKELTRQEPSEEERAGKSKDEIWQMRAEWLLEEIRHMSTDAQQVKLADRLSNLIEAHRTKGLKKLARYEWQTHEILKIVPKEVNPGLWESIAAEMAGHSADH